MEGPFTVSAANTSGVLTLSGATFANTHAKGCVVLGYNEAVRQMYNDWVRSGVPGVCGVIDLATAAEVGSTPPFTQSPLFYSTASNPHMSAAGYAAIAERFASSFAGL
jgi:hypothetical protein